MKRQQGVGLVMAIFILVVLSLLGGYMVKLAGVQHLTTASVIQGARAYQAARAGVEWGINQVVNGSCAASTTISPLGGFTGFSIIVNCSNQTTVYNEGDTDGNGLDDDDFYVYLITSTASYGSFSDSSYIYRQLKVTVPAD